MVFSSLISFLSNKTAATFQFLIFKLSQNSTSESGEHLITCHSLKLEDHDSYGTGRFINTNFFLAPVRNPLLES